MSIIAGLVTIGVTALTYLVFGRKYFAGGVCRITKDLSGKVVVITGGNSGLGKETARQLAKIHATVIIACRSAEKSLPVVEELKKLTNNNNIEFMKLDLSDLESIKEFTETFKQKYQRLDILINNAAVLSVSQQKSKDGFELMFGTNHLGPFYLTTLLLDVIKKSTPARIVNLSAGGHIMAKLDWDDLMYEKNKWDGFQAMGNSKLATILFSKELQEKLEGSDVKVVSLHPGVIATDVFKDTRNSFGYNLFFNWIMIPSLRIFGKTVEQGVQTTLYCALEEQDKIVGGAYYIDCKVGKESNEARSVENQKKMWEVSERLIASKVSK